MANALIVRRAQLPVHEKEQRAAQYVRMSTNMQKYSIQNQAAVIAAYAHANNLKIVRIYRDEGESGVHIKNRAGLQQLITDVSSGEADYGHVLVYDISRWGRFQDSDESAHYEFLCKRAGVKVAYCAELFDNDSSMLSSIVKNLKRVMAAEYSRELSAKVHAGQSRIVRLGFRAGAPVGYALQRELVDDKLQPKRILKKGEYKWMANYRVRVRPGAADQVAVVRRIFQQYLRLKNCAEIARALNKKGVPSATGKPWNRERVRYILRNENYIGNLVFNRTSGKLGASRIRNPTELWVRSEQCVEPIIEPEVFRRTQQIIANRWLNLSDGEMLLRLRRTLFKKGRLSATIINETSGLPHADSYSARFGSLRNVYRLIGYTLKWDHSFIDAKLAWAEVTASFVRQVAAELGKRGRQVLIERSGDRLSLDGTVISFRVARSYPRKGFLTVWRISQLRGVAPGLIVVLRLTDHNKTVLDYVFIPTKALAGRDLRFIRFTEKARVRFGFERFETLGALVQGINEGAVAQRQQADTAMRPKRRKHTTGSRAVVLRHPSG